MSTSIPNFALYGHDAQPVWLDLVHFERIHERSSLHDFRIDPHFHDGLIQVLYVVSGGGEVFIDGTHWQLYPQTVIVVPARHVHGFHFRPDIDGPVVTAAQRPLEAAASAFAPHLLPQLRRPLVLELSTAVRHVDALVPLFAAIERESRTYVSGDNAVGSALLMALLAQVFRIANSIQSQTDGESTAPSHNSMVVDRFRGMVDERFRQRLPMEDYAAALGITVGHLSRLCRECLGMSSLDVINARIVHEAERELVYSTLSIKQVAAVLGFSDDAYFGRFFKKHTGQKPTEFREAAWQKLKPQTSAESLHRA